MLVPLGLSDINAFFGVRDVGQGKYKDYLENRDYDEVIQALTI